MAIIYDNNCTKKGLNSALGFAFFFVLALAVANFTIIGFEYIYYDTVYLIKEAIEKAGTTDKEALVKAIKEAQFEGVTGSLTFDEKNNPVKGVTIIKIVNGDYTFDSVVSK